MTIKISRKINRRNLRLSKKRGGAAAPTAQKKTISAEGNNWEMVNLEVTEDELVFLEGFYQDYLNYLRKYPEIDQECLETAIAMNPSLGFTSDMIDGTKLRKLKEAIMNTQETMVSKSMRKASKFFLASRRAPAKVFTKNKILQNKLFELFTAAIRNICRDEKKAMCGKLFFTEIDGVKHYEGKRKGGTFPCKEDLGPLIKSVITNYLKSEKFKEEAKKLEEDTVRNYELDQLSKLLDDKITQDLEKRLKALGSNVGRGRSRKARKGKKTKRSKSSKKSRKARK